MLISTKPWKAIGPPKSDNHNNSNYSDVRDVDGNLYVCIIYYSYYIYTYIYICVCVRGDMLKLSLVNMANWTLKTVTDMWMLLQISVNLNESSWIIRNAKPSPNGTKLYQVIFKGFMIYIYIYMMYFNVYTYINIYMYIIIYVLSHHQSFQPGFLCGV